MMWSVLRLKFWRNGRNRFCKRLYLQRVMFTCETLCRTRVSDKGLVVCEEVLGYWYDWIFRLQLETWPSKFSKSRSKSLSNKGRLTSTSAEAVLTPRLSATKAPRKHVGESGLVEAYRLVGAYRLMQDLELLRAHTLVRESRLVWESRLVEAYRLVGAYRLVRAFKLLRAHMLARESGLVRESRLVRVYIPCHLTPQFYATKALSQKHVIYTCLQTCCPQTCRLQTCRPQTCCSRRYKSAVVTNCR
jgi:hypothetical protein